MIHGLLMALLLVASPQTNAFKLSGTVVREDKLDPATAPQSNQVRIQGPVSQIVPIRPDGTFEFANVRPGSYQLVVGPRITMPAMTIVVSDTNVSDVRVFIPLSLDITGKVIVEGNGPRPRFQIAFAGVGTSVNAVVTSPSATFTTTLSAGEYRLAITGLPAGYSVKSATIGSVDAVQQTFKLAAGSPTALTITLGVSSPPPWVRVRGRITGSATSVSLTGAAMSETLNATVGRDGSFEFPMVLPGTYTARTLPTVALAPAMPVTVGSTDVSNLELRVPATKEINGKITVRGTVPVPRLVFSLANGATSTAVAPEPITIVQGVVRTTTAGSVTVPTNVGADGVFRITLPEGERSITIVPSSLPAGYSVESFLYGGVDLTKNPLRVALNDTAEITIAVDATTVKPRQIRGKVNGLLTTAGVRVVLQGGNLGTGVESPVAPDGSFGFSEILPGNYTARLSLSGPVVSTSVVLGNNDVTNLVINYPRLFPIGAHVLVEGSPDDSIVPSITLEARSANGTVAASSPSSNNPTPMVLTVSDGEHRVSVRSTPAGYVLKSMQYGPTDLQKSPLVVNGPITWEIVVRLERATTPR